MTACDITAFQSCRGTSLCRCVWLQVHRDLGSCATQCERAFWRHRAASPAPEGQQGEEREASGIPKTEREHLQESQAVLGQNSCQEQQEYGLQTKVQVLPWPIGTLRTLDSARACGFCGHYLTVVGQSINRSILDWAIKGLWFTVVIVMIRADIRTAQCMEISLFFCR